MTQGHHGGRPARPLGRTLAVRPRVLPLEERAVPSTSPVAANDRYLAIGAEAGNLPYVRVIDVTTGETKFAFQAYESAFRGGVRVATGDVTGDGVPDIVTAPGKGGGPLVKVWDGVTGSMIAALMAYDDKFRGGIYVAVGDVNGDGHADIITGAGDGGGPHVKAFNGAWVVPPFHVETPTLPVDPPPAPVPGEGTTTTTGDGGATTTTGDGGTTTTTGDGGTTTTGDGGTTSTGNGSTPTTTTTPTPPPLDIYTPIFEEFMAYDMRFRGGVRVAAGDVTGDGKADIITAAGVGGGPHIRIFDSTTGQVYREFMAFGSTFTGGVYVTAGDVDGDGMAEVAVSTGLNGGARVNTFSGQNGRLVRSFTAASDPRTAIRVRMIDYDQDGRLDLLVADGTKIQVRDPLTNALKATFVPLDARFVGIVNMG